MYNGKPGRAAGAALGEDEDDVEVGEPPDDYEH